MSVRTYASYAFIAGWAVLLGWSVAISPNVPAGAWIVRAGAWFGLCWWFLLVHQRGRLERRTARTKNPRREQRDWWGWARRS